MVLTVATVTLSTSHVSCVGFGCSCWLLRVVPVQVPVDLHYFNTNQVPGGDIPTPKRRRVPMATQQHLARPWVQHSFNVAAPSKMRLWKEDDWPCLEQAPLGRHR